MLKWSRQESRRQRLAAVAALVAAGLTCGVARAEYWEQFGGPGYVPADNVIRGSSSNLTISVAGTTRAYNSPGSKWSQGTRNDWYTAYDISGRLGIYNGASLDVRTIESNPNPGTPRFDPQPGDSFEIMRFGSLEWLKSDDLIDPNGGPSFLNISFANAPLANPDWYWSSRWESNALFLDVLAPPTNVLAQWNVDAGGSWGVASNWTPGIPQAIDDTATFGSVITAPRTVTLDADKTVSAITFNNSNKYTVNPGAGGTLTLQTTSGPAPISVASGSHELNTPLNLASDLALDVTAGARIKLGADLTNDLTITKTGDGAADFAQVNGTGDLDVQAGTLTADRVRQNSLSIASGASVAMHISSPGAPQYQGDNAMISHLIALDIAHDGAPLGSRQYLGQLDLGNNDLVVDYDGVSPLPELTDMIRSGFNFLGWDGGGIVSSAARDDIIKFGIGIVDNAELTALGIGYGDGTTGPLFHGQAVDETSILVKFTYMGDADLDGFITPSDYFFIDVFGVGAGLGGWLNGDFDYDGVAGTPSDYFFIDQNWFGDPRSVGLPEPASLLLVAGLFCQLGRRRAYRIPTQEGTQNAVHSR